MVIFDILHFPGKISKFDPPGKIWPSLEKSSIFTLCTSFWTVWHFPTWRLTVSQSRRCPAEDSCYLQHQDRQLYISRTKTMTFNWTKVVQGLWSHDLEWSASLLLILFAPDISYCMKVRFSWFQNCNWFFVAINHYLIWFDLINLSYSLDGGISMMKLYFPYCSLGGVLRHYNGL